MSVASYSTVRRRFALVSLSLTAVACSTDTYELPPQGHRTESPACTFGRGTYDFTFPEEVELDVVECRRHADCTEGDNGLCYWDGYRAVLCEYDECQDDSACPFACRCRTEEGSVASNRCDFGTCSTDADCEDGQWCLEDGWRPGMLMCEAGLAYTCTTPDDECGGDDRCAFPRCTYDAELGHRVCPETACSP
jgi:hypothetical protein